MRIGIMAVASPLEIPYIDEWISWHRGLGIDEFFLCLNDWSENDRVELTKVIWKHLADKCVHTFIMDGTLVQLPAYNQMLETAKSYDIDWLAAIDIDEFIKIRSDRKIGDILEEHTNDISIGVNWRLYGNNGHDELNGDYSVLRRFTKCEKVLNHHVKQILNLRSRTSQRFINPHCLIMSAKNLEGHSFYGPFNEENLDKTHELEIAHYAVKSREECRIRRSFRRCDTGEPREEGWENFFLEHNKNDIEESELRYEK